MRKRAENMKVRVINKSGYLLPEYKTKGSAGMDLVSKTTVEIKPGETKVVPTGLFMEIPVGYEAQVRPRSGLSLKTGLRIANSPGTIDSDYRGEVGVIMENTSDTLYTIVPGDRIAQMVIAKYEQIQWEPTEELDETERGAGGYGSTGK